MPYTCCLRPALDAKRPVENPTIVPMDEVSGIREEIIRNLADDGGEVTVIITVSASKSGGFSQNTIRAVRENGDALQLELQIDESGSG